MARYNKKDLYEKAIRIYNPSAPHIDYDEFKEDVNRILNLCKILKQNKACDKEYSLRMCINWFIISHNLFGENLVNILFTVADEMIYPDILAYLFLLNLYPKCERAITIDDKLINLCDYAVDRYLLDSLKLELTQ